MARRAAGKSPQRRYSTIASRSSPLPSEHEPRANSTGAGASLYSGYFSSCFSVILAASHSSALIIAEASAHRRRMRLRRRIR